MVAGDYDTLRYLVERRTGLIQSALLSGSADAGTMRALAESILDLAEFDSAVIENNLDQVLHLSVVVKWGFQAPRDTDPAVMKEWARVRGAFMRVLTSSICHARSDSTTFSAASCSKVAQCAAEIVRVEVAAALATVREQAEGRSRPFGSHIFSCDVVGSNTLEAGTFLRLMTDSAVDFNTLGAFYMEVAGLTIELMSAHLSPDLCYANLGEGGGGGGSPRHGVGVGEDDGEGDESEGEAEDYEDPRQPILEAFFSLSSKLLGTINPQNSNSVPPEIEDFVASIVLAVVLDWTVSTGRANRGFTVRGLDPDDPATLVLLDFLPAAVQNGSVLEKVALQVR